MKSITHSVLLCSATLIYGIALEAQAPSILEPKVERREGRPPLWLSAEAVVEAEKIIDLDLIKSESLNTMVEKQRRALGDRLPVEKSRTGERPSIVAIPFSECKWTTFSTDHVGGTGSTSTLSDLAANSESIIRGAIRAVAVGFDSGVPSSLIEVEVSEVIKGSPPKSPIYIAYPVARFRIGPFHFCNATKGFEPRSGDEVLLFDYTGTVDRDDVLYAPRLEQLFFQNQSGNLVLPPQLKNTSDLETARTLDDVAVRLRSKLGAPHSRGGRR